LAVQVRLVLEDLSVQLDSQELEVVQALLDSQETQAGLVEWEMLVNRVGLETPVCKDLVALLDFREREGKQVTLEQVVRKVRLDSRVPRVSPDFRALMDHLVTKVLLEILDLLEHKDLKEDLAKQVSQSIIAILINITSEITDTSRDRHLDGGATDWLDILLDVRAMFRTCLLSFWWRYLEDLQMRGYEVGSG